VKEEQHSVGADRSGAKVILRCSKQPKGHASFISHQEALDTSTPMGKAMFTIIAAMAELERSVIRERVVAGMEYARLRGTKSGKPIGGPRAIFRLDEAQDLRTQGRRWRQIARQLGVSATTVRRACQDRI